MALAGSMAKEPRAVVVGPRDQAMRAARTCYDHLAGRLAVAMADAMIARGQIELSADGGVVTQAGAAFLGGLGVDLDTAAAPRGSRRVHRFGAGGEERP